MGPTGGSTDNRTAFGGAPLISQYYFRKSDLEGIDICFGGIQYSGNSHGTFRESIILNGWLLRLTVSVRSINGTA